MISLCPFDVSRPLLFSCLFYSVVTAVALRNITLALAEGTSDHGNPGLLCIPTRWTDLISFYLFNYVAHAATVLTRPGERSVDFAVTVVGCLLFPVMGLYRGIEAILNGSMFARDDLSKAARSGALCMLIRSPDWRPADGDEIRNSVFRTNYGPYIHSEGRALSYKPLPLGQTRNVKLLKEQNSGYQNDSTHVVTYESPWSFSKFGRPVYVHRQIIHGTYSLPSGYSFAIVPPNAKFTSSLDSRSIIEVASTYNLVKAVVAIAQTSYASLTLFRSRGDQIERYGYAAFGLTVAPYVVMSIMNLLGNLCRPDYASLYMVESTIMDEARERGAVFCGTVSRIEEETGQSVCSCRYGWAEDIERPEFLTDGDGKMVARFPSMAKSHKEYGRIHNGPCDDECPKTSSPMESSWSIKDVPDKMDYTNTKDDALLLIPSCNPLTLSSQSAEEGITTRYKIRDVSLKKTAWYSKHHKWAVVFEDHTYHQSHPFRWRFAKYFLTTLISLMPLIINGTLSHFKPGTTPATESSTWKVYTMQWLTFGLSTGLWFVVDQEAKDSSPCRKYYFGPVGRVTLYFVSASPAVGGFIVVGQMLWRYGVCTWVGS
ncbi:hypothetical protein K469DRAFT_699248 [Zopfia rhizophila CBS 207.26]|uniref:Uncharacterized protein n=1 Tax=Zopfia rhizophila CBS 207.26 TaxID=1314779 RepID=A0A6A6EXA4_9PEZI|nr:hypothetical protein K469DRAFT_699248 [Zopfia rhizophila CBS 207.26]